MDGWRQTLVSPTIKIHDAIKVIEEAGLQIALVIDENFCLLGTVTDGDLRRGLIKQISLNEPVTAIMNAHPTVAHINDSNEKRLSLMEAKKLLHLPILNNNNCLVDLIRIETLFKKSRRDNAVVLMAGGLGTRLRPLTDDCPKPLLKVGAKPVLEIVLENFLEYGFHRFYIAINYKGHLIQDYFGDGSRWGSEINYLCEDQRLGTAGALSLLPEKPDKPFFVMNADLITKVNLEQLLKFHEEQQANATLCVREYKHVIPYGVVNIGKENFQLIDIKEKPEQQYFVSAGIYVLNPDTLDGITKNHYLDMPNLLASLTEQNKHVATFPIREYWLDIGRLEDLERAHQEYGEVFA